MTEHTTTAGAKPTERVPSANDSDGKRRALYAGFPVAVGVSLAGLQVPHLVADVVEGMGLLAITTGAVLPLVLALVIAAVGYRLRTGDLRAGELRRVNGWFLLGIGCMTLVSGAVIVYELLEGARLTHVRYVLLDFATAGGIAGLLVGWYDAQNRRRQRQLRMFREVVEHAGHCIYFTAPDGTIEYVNPEFEAQTGYDREEVLGRTPEILNSGEQDEAFYEEMWETIRSGEVWQAELVNERRDGTHYHADQTVAPVTDEGGAIEHFVAITRDVTERKAYEAKLERQNERLERFASLVSHDLRNPLTVAKGHLELAKAETDDTEVLDEIEASLDRMEVLIEDVLALVRQDEPVEETDPVEVAAVAEAAWETVETAAATLEADVTATIEADESRLRQLFENLVRNAVEHGGPEVTVRVGETEDGFYVEDTGEGLSEEAREHLFETGFTTADEGTGLGLVIVEEIVDAHGWEIAATEGEAGGARFEISDVTFVQSDGA